jgi:hypothetical protein
MSGYSYNTTCLNCNNDMESYSDHKPLDLVSHQCMHCGYSIIVQETYLNLEELNDLRQVYDLELLKELPKQKLNLL